MITLLSLHKVAHLQIPTKRIDKLNLPWRLALHLKQSRTRDKYGDALRPWRCDIESVRTVEELHAARSVFRR